jgi:hypothetical protein
MGGKNKNLVLRRNSKAQAVDYYFASHGAIACYAASLNKIG